MNQRLMRLLIGSALVASLAACGGGGSSNSVAAGDSLVTTAKVDGYPNVALNIYVPAGGATRAIVALHGGGGNNNAIAYQLGLNSSDSLTTPNSINWDWLHANKVIMVFPQGQHIESNTGATTWSNYAMDSGQDDKTFLVALATKIRNDYGVKNITLMGHSMGGVMTNRMWCESNSTFDFYMSLAGPASQTFETSAKCDPGANPKPYMGVIGDSDPVMETKGNWDQPIWTINRRLVGITQLSGPAWINDEVINEQVQQQVRATAMCSDTVSATPNETDASADTWRNCGGKLKLLRVHGAGHGVAGTAPDGTPSLSTQLGYTAVAPYSNGIGLMNLEESQAQALGLK